MNIELQTREFHSADALLAHYRALKARRKFGPPPAPKPVIDWRGGAKIYDAPIGPIRVVIKGPRDVLIVSTPRLTGPKILQQVCDKHGVTLTEAKGESRSAHIVRARQEAAYRIRRVAGWSLPRIGELLGDRDHTTILHSIRQFEKLLAKGAATYDWNDEDGAK